MKPIHLDRQQRQEFQRRRRRTQDKRPFERLSAVLWVADGKTRFEVADLLGRSVRQLAEWLRPFRNRGPEALFTLHNQGDPGNLSAGQVDRLKREISTGRFRNSDQARLWVEEMFGVRYTPGGIKDLLLRVGASYHKVTGFLWKADPDKQREFVAHYERPGRGWRRRRSTPGPSSTRPNLPPKEEAEPRRLIGEGADEVVPLRRRPRRVELLGSGQVHAPNIRFMHQTSVLGSRGSASRPP
jgi:transposase